MNTCPHCSFHPSSFVRVCCDARAACGSNGCFQCWMVEYELFRQVWTDLITTRDDVRNCEHSAAV
jgi:hypothetical protein